MENENSVISKVDVRIIVSGLDIAEVVSKSVDNTQLERDYNIIVSSIIPTNNFEIAHCCQVKVLHFFKSCFGCLICIFCDNISFYLFLCLLVL